MKVRNHRLCDDAEQPYSYVASPNIYHNGDGTETELYPSLLILHYTAGVSSLGWLTSPESKASAHLLVSRCGLITQLVPFSRCAWHAGSKSTWKGRVNCNLFAIGVEVENLGRLVKWNTGWAAKVGDTYIPVDSADVLVAQHKSGGEPVGWHKYTEPQVEAVNEAAKVIAAAYGIEEVAGHDDVLPPPTKWDPGPAWDTEATKRLLGA